jgi:hypothetical protein
LNEIEEKKKEESIENININLISEKIEEKVEEKTNINKFLNNNNNNLLNKVNNDKNNNNNDDIPQWKKKIHNEKKEKILNWIKELNIFTNEIKNITSDFKNYLVLKQIIKFYEPDLIKEVENSNEEEIKTSLKELSIIEELPNFETESKSCEFLFKIYTKFTQPEYSSILQKKKIEENKLKRENKNIDVSDLKILDTGNNIVKIQNTQKNKTLKKIKKNIISIINETETEKKLNDIEDDSNLTNFIVLKYDNDNLNKLTMKGNYFLNFNYER